MNKKKIDKFVLGIILVSIVSSFIIAATIDNFSGESNPFVINFLGGDTHNYSIENIPIYAYFRNFSMNINYSFPIYNNFTTGTIGQGLSANNYAWVAVNFSVQEKINLSAIYVELKQNVGGFANFTILIYNSTNGTLDGQMGSFLLESSDYIYNSTTIYDNRDIPLDFSYIRFNFSNDTLYPNTYYLIGIRGLDRGGTQLPAYIDFNYGSKQGISIFRSTIGDYWYTWFGNNSFNYYINENQSLKEKKISFNGSLIYASNTSVANEEIELDKYDFIGIADSTLEFSFYSDLQGSFLINLTEAIYYTNLTINVIDRETNLHVESLSQITIVDQGNYSTDTGILNIDTFSVDPGPYSLIASNPDYNTQQTEFTLTDMDSTNVSIYLVNATSTGTGNLIVTVYDSFYNYQEGANTKLLEYKPTLDSFVEVAQCYTNTNGECIFDIELDTKFYIVTTSIIIDGVLYSAQSTTSGEIIKIDNTVIELHLATAQGFIADDLFDLRIYPFNTTLVNNVSYLTAYFDDISNHNHTVCIGYFLQNFANQIELNRTCVNGTSGIVNYADGYTLNRNYTYVAKIFVQQTDRVRVFWEKVYEALEGSFKSEYGALVKPIIILLLLISLGLGIYLKNLGVFSVLAIIIATVSKVIYPTLLGNITLVVIYIFCLLIFYFIKRKTEVGQ